MRSGANLFEHYDFILPPKYDGGYLIVALTLWLQRRQMGDVFTTSDVKRIVAELHHQYPGHGTQVDSLIGRLSRYLIRDEPGKHGRFRLTTHAKELVQFLVARIEKPYKDFPLQQTFDNHFSIQEGEIDSGAALRMRFDPGFISGKKQVVHQHLEALQDELNEAHTRLGKILQTQELSPVAMAEQFAITFRAFGDKAEDIGHSIASKDHFLTRLNNVVEQAHHRWEMAGNSKTEDDRLRSTQLRQDWEAALSIQEDLTSFFDEVEDTVSRIRAQIIFANDRLLELQDNFKKKSHLQIGLKRLLQQALQDAAYEDDEVCFKTFPQKDMPFEAARMAFPPLYPFELPVRNVLIAVPPDDPYVAAQREIIEADVQRQKVVAEWLAICNRHLSRYRSLQLHTVLNKLLATGADLQTAIDVAYELIRSAKAKVGFEVSVSAPLVKLDRQDLYVWTTRIAQAP